MIVVFHLLINELCFPYLEFFFYFSYTFFRCQSMRNVYKLKVVLWKFTLTESQNCFCSHFTLKTDDPIPFSNQFIDLNKIPVDYSLI